VPQPVAHSRREKVPQINQNLQRGPGGHAAPRRRRRSKPRRSWGSWHENHPRWRCGSPTRFGRLDGKRRPASWRWVSVSRSMTRYWRRDYAHAVSLMENDSKW